MCSLCFHEASRLCYHHTMLKFEATGLECALHNGPQETVGVITKAGRAKAGRGKVTGGSEAWKRLSGDI